MKKIFFQIALFLGILTMISCSSDLSDETQYGSIAGSVSDKKTGEPVSTVNVTLTPGGASTVTGSDGTFSFKNLEPGEYTIEISKEDYKINSANLYVKNGEPTSAHLLIERMPAMVTADRETLDFGDNQSLNTLSFNIVNAGYQDLDWEIEERCNWIIEIKPEKGTLKYGKTEGIVVVIDREMLEPGENKAVIVIRSSDGSSQMNVTAIGAEKNLPILNIKEPTDLTSSTAILNGEIISHGNPEYSERGFVISLDENPSLENTISKLPCPVSSSDQFSIKVTGLTYNKTYYVKAYAKNSIGVAYSSNEISFTTPMEKPSVNTLEVIDIDFNNGTATFQGSIGSVGIPPYTERGFVYGTLHNPTINDNKIAANGSGITGNFSKYATDLPKKQYYVRAYATSPAGTVYGEEVIVRPEWIEIPSAGIAVQTQDVGCGNFSSISSLCKNSRVGGYTDWRLPTIDELSTIYSMRNTIGNFENATYWSSTYYSNYENLIRTLNFITGEIDYWSSSYNYYGRAVRTLK